MKAPVWVVKMWSGGSTAVDLYLAARAADGWWSVFRRDALRFGSREEAKRAASHPGSRVVRLVPRKRGGR